MGKYIVVARAATLGSDPKKEAYEHIGEITGSEDVAVVEAYAIVRADKTPNVGEYWLVPATTPQTYETHITISKAPVPICLMCWGKNLKELEPLKHYRNPAGVHERCSRCGKGTTDAWYTWLDGGGS